MSIWPQHSKESLTFELGKSAHPKLDAKLGGNPAALLDILR